jgi:hypothetical protein
MTGRDNLSSAVFDACNELWMGLALAHDRFMRFGVIERRDRGCAFWTWRISWLMRRFRNGRAREHGRQS